MCLNRYEPEKKKKKKEVSLKVMPFISMLLRAKINAELVLKKFPFF